MKKKTHTHCGTLRLAEALAIIIRKAEAIMSTSRADFCWAGRILRLLALKKGVRWTKPGREEEDHAILRGFPFCPLEYSQGGGTI